MKIFAALPKNEQTETFLTAQAREVLCATGEFTQFTGPAPADKQLFLQQAADTEVLLTGWATPRLEKEDILQLPRLRLIAHTGGSVASLLAPEVYETGVRVISGNDIYARSVAEGCLCYTLCGLRRIEHYASVLRTRPWREEVFRNQGLIGKKVGIIGFGATAKHFVSLLAWFGCEILIYSGHLTGEEAAANGARKAELEEIFSQCDVISVHASSTPQNIGMVSRQLMETMKPSALLVNTARGDLIDEAALFELLQQGRFHAVLDVYATEPPRPDDPIRTCENVLLIPHMAGPTMDMRQVVTMELCRDMRRLWNGEPLAYEINAAAAGRMSRH